MQLTTTNSNLHFKPQMLCSKCMDRGATLECRECDQAGMKLCYNCDLYLHDHSYKSMHHRSLIQNTSEEKLLYKINTSKNQKPPLASCINTPRMGNNIPNQKTPNFVDSKARNHSVGSLKKQVSTVPIKPNVAIKPLPIEATINRYSKYQEIISKKDQVIESIKSNIESIKTQITNTQNKLCDSRKQLDTLRSEYNDSINKMHSQIKGLEDTKIRSVSIMYNTNQQANSEEVANCKQQIYSQYCNYKNKYQTLVNEKSMQAESLQVIKTLLKEEEAEHKKSKAALSQTIREIGLLRMELAKKNSLNA